MVRWRRPKLRKIQMRIIVFIFALITIDSHATDLISLYDRAKLHNIEILNNEIFISGELFSIDGRRRYYYKVRSETKKSIEAGKTLGKKLKEQSGGDYKK